MDIYREFRILSGQFAGTHRVYWNNDICRKYEHIDTIKKWAIDSLEVGDWVESLDGSCCQLLDKRIYTDKKKRQHTFYRFPMTTITSYYTMKGISKWNNFFASLSSRSYQLTNSKADSYTHQKVRFVAYIINGINPLKAYRLAFNNYTTMPIASLHRRVTNILKERDTLMELREQLAPFRDELEQKIDNKTLLGHIEALLENSVKGSKEHRENIRFVLELLNKTSQKKQIKDIEYEEMDEPVPMLGSN